MMRGFWQDLRYGARVLRKRPGFTLAAILALALGIGANSAIFSVVNAVVLRPLPYPNPDRLVMVGYAMHEISPPNFLDLQEQNRVFERMAAVQFWSANLMGVDQPERLQGFLVSPDLFPLLGVGALRGRTFRPEEAEAGQNNVVLLSYGLWQRRFGQDPNIVGKTLNINGKQRTVVGIMPPDFQFYRPADVWAPLFFDAEDRQTRGASYLIAAARLKPGVTLEQAQGDVNNIARRLEQQYPKTNTNVGFKLITLHESVVGIAQPALLILLGAVGFVLLIACANVANLLLARAASRQKEIALRFSLGAKRGRLIRQLLTESVLLSLLGGSVGLWLGWWGVRLLVANVTRSNFINLPRAEEIGIDPTVLLFTLGISLLSGILFGLAPALQSSKLNLSETLKEGGGGASGGFRSRRMRSALVVTEVALSFVLLIGAGLLIRSFVKLLEVNPGFDPKQVLTFDTSLSPTKYVEDSQTINFYNQALERIRGLPGVTSVGVTSNLPLGGSDQSGGFFKEGEPTPVAGDIPRANLRFTSADYFSAMGIPLKAGRYFSAQDTKDSVPVAVINETMARRHWPNQDPLGKRIRVASAPGATEQPWLSIVGVVGDVKHSALSSEPRSELYQVYTQNPARSMTFVIRTGADPLSLVQPVRGKVAEIDKDQPLFNIRTMGQVVSDSAALSRFSMVLLGIFALVALVLAAVGIYGVMSYSVSLRTHEIGIRMALGASSREIRRLVVGQGLKLALIGEVIGLIVAFAITRLLAGLLFGVGSADPITFAGVLLLLLAVAFAACYFPARRATRVDPLDALRYE